MTTAAAHALGTLPAQKQDHPPPRHWWHWGEATGHPLPLQLSPIWTPRVDSGSAQAAGDGAASPLPASGRVPGSPSSASSRSQFREKKTSSVKNAKQQGLPGLRNAAAPIRAFFQLLFLVPALVAPEGWGRGGGSHGNPAAMGTDPPPSPSPLPPPPAPPHESFGEAFLILFLMGKNKKNHSKRERQRTRVGAGGAEQKD